MFVYLPSSTLVNWVNLTQAVFVVTSSINAGGSSLFCICIFIHLDIYKFTHLCIHIYTFAHLMFVDLSCSKMKRKQITFCGVKSQTV